MICVSLPAHLRTLARVNGDVWVEVDAPVTPRSIVDALERDFPVLRGTIRDRTSGHRRPLVRYFACETDVSHASQDAPLPEAIVQGREPFLIVGALAGG